MAEDDMYLENLKEFVLEEDKIVTYKWLSRTLSVNVNQAKQMLYAFVQKTDGQHSLSIIYIVGGLVKTSNGQLIQKYLFADKQQLEDIKKCYDQLTGLHIYSVQKNRLKDSNVLYMADYDLQKQNIECSNRWSNITCQSAVFKGSDGLKQMHTKDIENEEPIPNDFPKASKPVSPEPVLPRSKPVRPTSTKNAKSKVKTVKKGDVASFFARQMPNKSKETQDTVKDAKMEAKKDPIGKQKEKRNEENKEDDQPSKNDASPKHVINKESKNVKTNSAEKAGKKHFDETSGSVEKLECEDRKENTVKKSSTNQEEKKKRKQSPKHKAIHTEKQEGRGVKRDKAKTSPNEENNEKDFENKRKRRKRRRVKNFSDSSDEDEVVEGCNGKSTGRSEDSVPIPDQQPNENTSTEVTNVVVKRRKRKRVLKSKTYLNDEGYMVTEKVYESESTGCSDIEETPKMPVKVDENKTTVKNSTQKTVPKKKPVNKATKQSSLTSFFKRA